MYAQKGNCRFCNDTLENLTSINYNYIKTESKYVLYKEILEDVLGFQVNRKILLKVNNINEKKIF